MVYLEDGRKELYQWDTGISVASTEACDVMEITRETYPLTRDADATLVGTMYRADVPDELLTEAGYLKIALVTVAGESRRTNAVYRMRIKPRAKPKYVFTDHRVDATTQEILMRISALEEKIKNGTIEGAVLYTKPQALKEEEKKTARENIDAVSSKNADGTERDFVYTTDTASIGQTVVVSEVDSDGKPTKYKHTIPPTGGGGGSGKDGATFTPSVSGDGTLSWTNNGGLPNPNPVNIKGQDGAQGTPGAKGVTFTPEVSSDGVLSWTNDGNLSNPLPATIKGGKGDKGEKGDKGDAGITYTPSVSSDGEISWSNNGGQANPAPINIKGPQGEQGIQGATGAKGDKGETGATYTPNVSNGILSWTNDGGLPNPDPVTIGSGGSGTVEGAVLYSQEQNLTNAQKSTACDNIGALRGELDDGQAVNVVTTTDTPTVGQTVVVTGFDSDGSPTYGHTDLGSGSGGTGGTPNAVQYVPQTLTQDQQTQARKNIDAQSQVYAVKRANPWSAEDCVNAPVRGLKLYGATEQNQYRGKNLYDMSLLQTTEHQGMTFSYIPEEDCICIDGTSNLNDELIISTFKVPIEANQSYTLTCYPVSGSVTAESGQFKVLYIEVGDAESEYTGLETVEIGTTKKFRTETNSKAFYTRTRFYIDSEITFNNLKFRIQFEKSSTSTDYEPYVGGMPSPSPSYPQPVKYNNLMYTLKNDAEYNGGSVTAPSLYRIGDVQDEWDAVTAHGIRRIKKMVIDGNANWWVYKSEIYEGFKCVGVLESSLYYRSKGLCNQLTVDTIGNKIKNGLWIGLNNNIIYCINNLFYDNTLPDKGLENWKAHLNEHPLEIYYTVKTTEEFTDTPASQLTTPDGYAQFLPSGDGVAGDIEAEYAVDVEKRYVPKETYTALEERVAALEAAAIGV